MTKQAIKKEIERLSKLIEKAGSKKVSKKSGKKAHDHTSHHFGYIPIVSFKVDGKVKTSSEVEGILGTRSLQRYRDNPGTVYTVDDSKGKSHKVATTITDKKLFSSRPRHRK